jgi:hypothetical protein
MNTLHVDFNEVDEHGRLIALIRCGDIAELIDGDGNACQGTIERIEGQLIYVLIDWNTWTASPSSLGYVPKGENINPVGNPILRESHA